jgi:AmmeMemoRadiSam system protein A
MSLVYVGYAPHPPILIPEVNKGGGVPGEEDECPATTQGMDKLAGALSASGAEILVVVSPHTHYAGDILTCLEASNGKLEGDLRSFNAPGVRFSLETVPEILESLQALGAKSMQARLDHGVTVPLYFLQRAGWQGRLVVLSSPQENPELWGEKIAQILDDYPGRCAILASGDLSHVLKEDGPYGFHPSGPLFDNLIVQGLRQDPSTLTALPETLVEEAAQCGYHSLLLALGARTGSCQVFSYEGPFGVGYLTAELYSSSPLAKYARACLKSFIEGNPTPKSDTDPPDDPLLTTQKSCFVTLHKEGELRGCIGTIEPVYPTLAEEIHYNAISAGTCDPRFLPVEKEELPHITISVDVLGGLEKIVNNAELDPHQYGVVVRGCGSRVGLLLPRLDGIDTPEEQLAIVLKKADIRPDEDIELWRFQVDRYYE